MKKVLTTTPDFGDEPKESKNLGSANNPETVEEEAQKPQTPADDISLIKDAQAYMGPELVKYFSGGLSGTNGRFQNFTPSMSNFCKTLGPFLLNITPSTYNDGSYNSQNTHKVEMLSSIDSKLLQNIFHATYGPYYTQTDLLSNITVNQSQNQIYSSLDKIMPEYMALTNNMRTDSTNRIVSGHPLMVVMGMAPENRALAGLAISDAISSGRIDLNYVRDYTKRSITTNFMPLESLIKVAEKYKQKDIQKVVEDYNQTIGKYVSKWQ